MAKTVVSALILVAGICIIGFGINYMNKEVDFTNFTVMCGGKPMHPGEG